jgi:hypothetical protein
MISSASVAGFGVFPLKWFGCFLVEPDVAEDLAFQIGNGSEDAARTGGDGEECKCQANPDNDRLIEAVAESYRTDTVRISRMTYAKPSSMRYFMRPFVNNEER